MKAKRKIKPTRKASYWPCGSCRKNAEDTDCIFCETCNQWFHSCCENITVDDFGTLRNTSVQYMCNKCFACEVGDGEYNYNYGLSRLVQALPHGKDVLRLAAKREQEMIPDFDLYNSRLIPQEFIEVDLNANSILEKCKLTSLGKPSLTTGDGNCLFNAVSIALSGHEGYAKELRLRTAIDMAMNGEIYKSRTDYQELVVHSPTFDESMADCCNDKSWSSIFTMISLSIVIGKPIRSVYPPMNGLTDPVHIALSKTFWAQCPQDDTLTLLWSRQSNVRGKRYANHFVPLIQSEKHRQGCMISNNTSTPVINRKRKASADFTITNKENVTFKVYKIDRDQIKNQPFITPIKPAYHDHEIFTGPDTTSQQFFNVETSNFNDVSIGFNTCPRGLTSVQLENTPITDKSQQFFNVETSNFNDVSIGFNTCPRGLTSVQLENTPITDNVHNSHDESEKKNVGIGSSTCPLGPTNLQSGSPSYKDNTRHAKQKKRQPEKINRSNIADEILEVFDMIHTHPFVQTIIHSKDKVPIIICYTTQQIIDMRQFLSNKRTEPIGIDRTFNLGSFYVTTLVYKNYRLLRKDTNSHPVFLGPMMLHKDATYSTYKAFLETIATALDDDINMLQIRISDQMDFGTDDEKALTKAIDHVFPKSTRLLCTKHLKDNINFFVQNKVAIDQKCRAEIINDIFGASGIVECNTTIDFEEKTSELSKKLEKYPSLEKYFTNLLKPRMEKYVINPNKQQSFTRKWTNNACESLNNILKLSTDWRPQKSKDLILKLYSVVDLHYHDYRAALHGVGNYILAPQEKRYAIPDALWRCKSEEEKKTAFLNFLKDKKKQQKNTDYTISNDGKFRVANKAKGIAKKPFQRKRARNERANKRY